MSPLSTISYSMKGTAYSTLSLLGLVISFPDDLIRDQVMIGNAATESAAMILGILCLVTGAAAFAFHVFHASGHESADETISSMMVGVTRPLPAALAVWERWGWMRETS